MPDSLINKKSLRALGGPFDGKTMTVDGEYEYYRFPMLSEFPKAIDSYSASEIIRYAVYKRGIYMHYPPREEIILTFQEVI